MATIKPQAIDISEIDKEIAELDEEISRLQAAAQRRTDLIALKQLTLRLWGVPSNGSERSATPFAKDSGNGNGNSLHSKDTIAGQAWRVLATKGHLNISGLLAAMRESGWKGSGEDPTDKRRIYSAIHGKPQFILEDGFWDIE